MKKQLFSAQDWDNQQLGDSEAYADQVRPIFQDAIIDLVLLSLSLGVAGDKLFSFSRYPQATTRVDAIMARIQQRLQAVISRGVLSSLSIANAKNDALLASVVTAATAPALLLHLATQSPSPQQQIEAATAFQARRVGGLNLSQRVFRYTGQFKREIELGLDIGLGEGRSAQQISQSLRGYLEQPDRLFRRVQNKRGNLVLSKAANAYHPGPGVYRSSYKNAMRLTRTEINQAYRQADYDRWQGLPFVVGIDVRRSGRASKGVGCDICGPLAGRYPADFKFLSWHPQCRCSAIPILATSAELQRLNELVLTGKSTAGFNSENRVTEPHQGWTDWLDQNRDKIERAKSVPYFVSSNKAYV